MIYYDEIDRNIHNLYYRWFDILFSYNHHLFQYILLIVRQVYLYMYLCFKRQVSPLLTFSHLQFSCFHHWNRIISDMFLQFYKGMACICLCCLKNMYTFPHRQKRLESGNMLIIVGYISIHTCA